MSLELVVDGAKVTARALTFPEQARAIRITSVETYQSACEFLKTIKALRTEIADTFDPHIDRAFQAHRALVKEKKEAEAPLQDAELSAKRALVAWDTEQERLRRVEQQRLEEEARQREEERRLEEAIALEAEAQATGDASLQMEATALLEQPVQAPAVAVARFTPKVDGISYRETWSCRLNDLSALVRYVAEHPQFLGLLQFNQTTGNQLARSMRARLKVPGIEAVATKDVAASRR